MKLTLSELYSVFGAPFVPKDAAVKGICTDTRNIKKGDVFFCLIGITDGHKYAAEALKKGALAVVCSSRVKEIAAEKQVMVKDTTRALLKLAKYYFKKFGGLKTVGVTGSNGKTTVKELSAAFLSKGYKTLKSVKSFNNAIGLPLTVFGLKDSHEAMVVELGMNKPGEIRELVSAIQLDAAVITNIGRAHIGNFRQGIKGVAKAKAEIMEGVKRGGAVIINADDDFYKFLSQKSKVKGQKLMTFGIKNAADVKVKKYLLRKEGSVFETDAVKGELKIRLRGIHNIYNAAAAIAVAKLFKVGDAKIKKALSRFGMEGFMRFEETALKSGVNLINDCYNANPDSFKASIETLKNLKPEGLVVLMGDMLELGDNAPDFHTEIGWKFRELDIKKFFVYGKNADYVRQGYGGAALAYSDREKLARDLKAAVKPGDTVFVKGSRGNKLEEIIKGL